MIKMNVPNFKLHRPQCRFIRKCVTNFNVHWNCLELQVCKLKVKSKIESLRVWYLACSIFGGGMHIIVKIACTTKIRLILTIRAKYLFQKWSHDLKLSQRNSLVLLHRQISVVFIIPVNNIHRTWSSFHG